ncbi:MAG: hypothetical protein QJR08_10255 [Bacillota bacterium]|nr:hypothetical protein [Bacillota bacterium]
MRTIWEELAKTTHRDRDRIEEEAASAWLLQELRETDREIAAYVRRYSVTTPDELERAIHDGREEGHPAWEDKLAWDNLIAYRDRLLTALAAVGGRDEGR